MLGGRRGREAGWYQLNPDSRAAAGVETDLRSALAAARSRLAEAGVASARNDAEELAAHLLGVRRGDLVRHDRIDAAGYEALVARRVAREPLQHLTGVAHFRRVSVAVGPGVFVPRPETEVMVGAVVDFLATLPPGARVVDLCTGSGVIALSVVTEVPGTQVHAVEVDPGAYDWATRNLAGTAVTLHLADARTALAELDGTFDVVISNPPYIPMPAWESVTPEVRDHDPAAALWSGEDGLDMMRAVVRRAAELLRPGGLAVVEHAEVQAGSVPALFRGAGCWRAVADHKDLAGRDRFVTAVRV
ncbi:MAG TPA: peptide chain release factor N(5)-glutamine methyltransferase [Sporichthyaceae bacterium]|nr:peptide chain release factor N(5)-glutamine methyltransferase [Sporichthyaceae bacterium]